MGASSAGGDKALFGSRRSSNKGSICRRKWSGPLCYQWNLAYLRSAPLPDYVIDEKCERLSGRTRTTISAGS